MHELEVKILDIDVPRVMKRLHALDAKKVFEGEIRASYFNFSRSKAHDPLPSPVRLRKKGDLVELCYKLPTGETRAKAMIEYETHVESFDATRSLLLAMGMRELPKSKVVKQRVSYRVGHALYEFDTLPRIPTFLEIEAQSMHYLIDAVAAIGYTMADTKAWTGKQVINYYRRGK
jgi:predicted adenylyl cyclase CyaB